MNLTQHTYALAALTLVLAVSACGGSMCKVTSRASGERYDSIYSKTCDAALLRHADDSLRSIGHADAERIHVLKQLGRVLRNQSDFEDALSAHREGLELALRHLDTVEAVRAYNNIGTDYRRMGLLDNAAEQYYSALQLNDSYSDAECFATRKNRVVALNGLGNIYLSMGDLCLADSIFRQALATEHALGSHLGQAINLSNIGSIFETQGMLDSARIYYERSLAENEAEGSRLGVALCHINFGSLHERADDYPSAIADYRRAYDMLHDGSDQWHWLQAAVALAKAYLSTHDRSATRHYLDTAWAVAVSIGSLEHEAEVARLRSSLAEEEGDMRGALDYFRQSLALSDSVAGINKAGNTHETRLRYKEGVMRDEMTALQRLFSAERRAMVMTIVAITLALVIVMGLAAWLIVFVRRRIKHHRRLIAEYERRLEQVLGELQEASTANADSPATASVATATAVATDSVPATSATTGTAPASAVFTPSADACDVAVSDSHAAANELFMRDFNKLINDNLDSPDLSVAMLSQHLGMSQRQLSRKVRQLTELDTQTCIRTARIRQAKRLLRHSDMSVFDVAVKCGFDSASYFSRVFRLEVGKSPSDYRRGGDAA